MFAETKLDSFVCTPSIQCASTIPNYKEFATVFGTPTRSALAVRPGECEICDTVIYMKGNIDVRVRLICMFGMSRQHRDGPVLA
jgi:hypothetical protein